MRSILWPDRMTRINRSSIIISKFCIYFFNIRKKEKEKKRGRSKQKWLAVAGKHSVYCYCRRRRIPVHFTSHLVPTIIPELPNASFSFCGFFFSSPPFFPLVIRYTPNRPSIACYLTIQSTLEKKKTPTLFDRKRLNIDTGELYIVGQHT
jgi:hypothetical protein